MMDKTNRGIEDEVNSLLNGKCSFKRRATGEVKAMRALKLGVPEAGNQLEDIFPQNIWVMVTKDIQYALRQCDSINIGIVK